MRRLFNRFDVRVSLVYCLVAAVWIIASDRLVSALFSMSAEALERANILKGLGFVAITTAALFLVVSSELKKRLRLEDNLRMTSRLYRLLSLGNHLVVKAREEQSLLQSICDLMVNEGGYRLAWVAYKQADPAARLTPMASDGFNDRYLEEIWLTWDDTPTGNGPAGKAIRTGAASKVRYINSDPTFIWRDQAQLRGYQSVLSLPIRVNGEVVGAIIVYSAFPDAFDQDEENLLMELADDLGYGIWALRAAGDSERVRRALQDEREISPVGISIVNPQGRIVYANSQAEHLLGLARDVIISRTYNSPEWRITDYKGGPFPEDQLPFARVMREGKPVFHIQHAIEWPSGRRVLLDVNCAPIFDRDGQIVEVIAVMEDVTARMLADTLIHNANAELEKLHSEVRRQNQDLEHVVEARTAELRGMNERMSTVLDNVSDAIMLLSLKGTIETTNLSFDQMFGYDRDELFGQPVSLLDGSDTQGAIATALEKVIAEQARHRIQISARRKDGTTFDADVTLAIVKNNSGHLVCSVHDITHLKEIERVKDQFVSMVSHELRTPISSIMLSVETITRYYDRMSDAQKLEKLAQVQQQAATLTEFTTAILDTSRFEVRKHQPVTTLADVRQSLLDVVEEMTPLADANQQQLVVVAGTQSIFLRADYSDISRVWRNLISNAVKYTGQGSIIEVILHPPSATDIPDLAPFGDQIPPDVKLQDCVVGMVHDNGPGIRPEDMPMLFQRFFRGWAAETSIPGSGLGLPLVRDILRSYQGDIAVVSSATTGTIFCFWLPASYKAEA